MAAENIAVLKKHELRLGVGSRFFGLDAMNAPERSRRDGVVGAGVIQELNRAGGKSRNPVSMNGLELIGLPARTPERDRTEVMRWHTEEAPLRLEDELSGGKFSIQLLAILERHPVTQRGLLGPGERRHPRS